jgi:hypothetical protein
LSVVTAHDAGEECLSANEFVLLLRLAFLPCFPNPPLSFLRHYTAISMQGPAALFSPLVLLFFVAWGLRQVAATSTNNPSFFEQSFFFDYDPPGTTIPIPVTRAVVSSFWFILKTHTTTDQNNALRCN